MPGTDAETPGDDERPPHRERSQVRLGLIPRRILMGLVRGYQMVLSPHFPPSCRYSPSCSEYALLALEEYGALRGGILTVWRLLRCAPWGGSGYDPPRWFGQPAVDARESTESPHR